MCTSVERRNQSFQSHLKTFVILKSQKSFNFGQKEPTENEQYAVVEDKLYHITHLSDGKIQYRVVIPHSLIPTILQYFHFNPLDILGSSKPLRECKMLHTGMEC